MEGSITEKDVHNIPRCPLHKTMCAIKTGSKQNATYGKSFFICNNLKERCTFSQVADHVETTKCLSHKKLVELKSFAKKADGLRCYFRCVYGKDNGLSWCGDVKIAPNPKIKDITNQQKGGDSFLPKKETKQEYQPATAVQPTREGFFASDKNSGNDQDVLDHSLPSTLTSLSTVKDSLTLKGITMEKNGKTENVSSSGSNTTEEDKSNYNLTKLSFRVPRNNNRVSDISEASSHDSSARSDVSSDSITITSTTETKSNHASTIEICSSEDEDDDRERHDIVDGGAVRVQCDAFFPRIADLELKIRKQKELLEKIGPITHDKGQKIKDDIERLTQQLSEAKLQEKHSQTSNAITKGTKEAADMNKKLPSMANQTSIQKYTINLGHNVPQIPESAIASRKNAPVFGGRMTDKRLQEVGRMTKEAIEHLHKSLDTCPTPSQESEDPENLKVSLMTHQRQALAWLLWRETQTPSCGILADDMGLGKTLTMISLTLKSKQKKLRKITELPKDSTLTFSEATLIVCPASLIHQWKKEIENRVEKLQLRVCVYHGPNRECRVQRLAHNDIVLTTYTIVGNEGKPYVIEEKEKKPVPSEWKDTTKPKKAEPGPIFKIFWRRIILDEGHTIKNHRTNVSIAICSLEAESRWIVTGTPIQNQTMDLYSLIKFMRVSPFDELKFWKNQVDNKTSSGRKRMNSIVTSLLLRRTKDQIDAKTGKPLVSLPQKEVVVHQLKLSEIEYEVHELIQNFSRNMFTQFLDLRKDTGQSSRHVSKSSDYKMPSKVLGINAEKAIEMFGLGGINASNSGCLLVLILRLRQCCSHLSLICSTLDNELCKDEGIDIPLEDQLGNMSIDEYNFERQVPKELKKTFQSTKLKVLLDKLRELQNQSKEKGRTIKSVIVSQWAGLLDVIAHHLKIGGFKFDFITGSVNAKKRADIVEEFNRDGDPQVMLISLKAGGVGLNLIGGSHLFLIDQHWNPSLEDQACDRIYRVGQKNDVVIHRFLCTNTVEERIVQIQERKKTLANNVLYGGKNTQKLTLDDLKMIFGISR